MYLMLSASQKLLPKPKFEQSKTRRDSLIISGRHVATLEAGSDSDTGGVCAGQGFLRVPNLGFHRVWLRTIGEIRAPPGQSTKLSMNHGRQGSCRLTRPPPAEKETGRCSYKQYPGHAKRPSCGSLITLCTASFRFLETQFNHCIQPDSCSRVGTSGQSV